MTPQPRDTRGRFCRKAEKAKPTGDFYLCLAFPIGLGIFLFLGAMVGNQVGYLQGYNTGLATGIQQGIQQENARDLKADAYTQGMIDGRASILSENSHGIYKPNYMGVPTEPPQNRTPEWRAYANCIAYDICPNKCSVLKTTDANGNELFRIP